MKLATLRRGGRDGTLAVVDRALERCVPVPHVAPTLQAALDDWERLAPRLAAVAADLAAGAVTCERFDPAAAMAPLPRAWQFLDGSAYLPHVERVRRARGAGMPPNLLTDPLMYQGCSAPLLGPCDPLPAGDPAWGLDYEGEVGVVIADLPAGAGPAEAAAAIRLLVLVNDTSLRGLIPPELAKGFGFVHGKPPSALGPVAVTPDEAGPAWDGRRLHLPLVSRVNGALMGRVEAGEDMQFDFPALVAHAAATRPLPAGTLVGSGTVSNRDPARGFSCLLERRLCERMETGEETTPFLRPGDRVTLDMPMPDGTSLFGVVEQRVLRHHASQNHGLAMDSAK